MSFISRSEQQQMLEAAALENAKRECIAAVYAEHQEFVRCEANNRAIIDACSRWANSDSVLPSVAIFNEAMAENPGEIKNFARQSEAITREQLTEQIIELLAAKGKGHDVFTLKQEEKRLTMLSIPALRARLADLQIKAKMASIPVPALKAFVKDAHTDKRKYPGFPELPKTVWNGTAHVPLNAAAIKAMDAWEIRKYSRLYSQQQLNDRIKEG
jgi:hypothetical protein